MNRCNFLSHPRSFTLLGYFGLADGLAHLVLPHIPKIVEDHPSWFDLSYYSANEAMLFASAVALFVAKRLQTLDKRLQSQEDANSSKG